MAGIMSPIAGETKKRTCYFFDSGASLSLPPEGSGCARPARLLVREGRCRDETLALPH